MEMTGEQRIPARREIVWQALNDPEILQACIPGCQELVKTSETEMTAVAVVKVGPISARFQGAVTLSDLDAPNGYRISGEGQGGVAGHAKGGAVVRLTADGDETLLAYDVTAQVGGKLAQLGGRMIDATAKTMAAAFFKTFAAQIAARYGAEGRRIEVAPAARATPSVKPVAQSAAAPSVAQAPTAASGRGRGLIVAVLAAAMAVLWIVSPSAGLAAQLSPEFLVAVQMLLIAAVGYLLGRQQRT